MKLTYQTGIVTLVQFVALTLLNIGTATTSVVSTCHGNSGDCVSNAIVSLIFFMLVAVWFAMVWILGFAAQQRRNKQLARSLIVAESMITVVALFNSRNHPDVLSLVTSLVDLFLAIWVILLAIRLVRAKGGRVVAKQRPRQRVR